MNDRPAFFEPIRQRAVERWDQLESDPELAGPWHQLFKQVQSPRHILSELLQNADDAGATEANVSIEDGAFIFSHNGEDFTEEHFASLCRFGYSNKRALHTIGFRGIGFKSTFSLGGCVELYTPTLSIKFNQRRFTEPKWADNSINTNGQTTVRVEISDDHRLMEVEKNLEEWFRSPVSLLFFKHIRRIQIGGGELHWNIIGPGPVPNTEWLVLNDDDEKFLIARSAPEQFPEECLIEINQERLLQAEENAEFPPCVIEIVLGSDGRLFVVLPTGVTTELPFACNAPFIQDPARLKIKDPETSPTNRWLLNRAGTFAGEVMLEWLEQSTYDAKDRSCSYDLMPDVNHEESSLEGVCGTIVEKAFAKVIEGKEYLLTEDGQLTTQKQCISVPKEILNVWSNKQVSMIFDGDSRPILSKYVSRKNRKKLINWDVLEIINVENILNSLVGTHPPKPKSWRETLLLWSYIAPTITGYKYNFFSKKGLCIIPVQGKEVFYGSSEVIRLGEKKMLPSKEDWEFLGDRISVLDQRWLRYLSEQRRLAETNDDGKLSAQVDAAYAVLAIISMDEPSDTGKVIDQVALDFFSQETVTLVDAIRLAQISAKLGAKISQHFRFVTQDRHLRYSNSSILFDEDGSLDLLFPDEWNESHILHSDYLGSFTSCTREEWSRWVSSGQANLQTFWPFVATTKQWLAKAQVNTELQQRGFTGTFSHKYKNPYFQINDWDFDEKIWEFWESVAEEDSSVWGKVAEKILTQPDRFWAKNLSASVKEESSNGHSRFVIREDLAPLWILKLRGKSCLRDTHGILRKPEELLRRTPETDALRDVEAFIHPLLDNEKSRTLLIILGVGGLPTGPKKILNRLKALAYSDNPPPHEVEKWYSRLDQLVDGCSTEEFNTVRNAFVNDKLILTEKNVWVNLPEVFLSFDEEDVPGAETVRASVRDLTFWRKIGVADRPTVELAIKWLQGIPSGEPLSEEDARRVRALLPRHAKRIWEECQHWLNLAGEWVTIEEFDFALTMQTLIPWKHLHPWVKQKTADFHRLSLDITEAPPFSILPPLAAQIEDNFSLTDTSSESKEEKEWLRQIGIELQRIKIEDEEEANRIRVLARDLASTAWQNTVGLEIISYIDGKPAGTSRQADAIWVNKVLYVEKKHMAKLARPVAQELGRSFLRPEVVDAIKLCFDRPSDFITEYMEANFNLIPREKVKVQEVDTTSTIYDDGVGDSPVGSAEEEVVHDDIREDDREENAESAEVESNIITNDDSNETSVEIAGIEEGGPVARQKPKKAKPSIMERHAIGQGYTKESDTRFFDNKGNFIDKASGSLFPWEKRSASGEVIRYYWAKDHCLEREPLQLEADIWGVLEKFPETYIVVLSSPDGKPVEFSGTLLIKLRDSGDLNLHPSTYRLVYKNDKNI